MKTRRAADRKYTGTDPNPVFAEDSPYWQLVGNEFYVRDINGKEIAVYENTNLLFWNVWGLDNVGKVNSDGSRYFYLKDHLGSIRAVVDATNSVVSAQDYDMWGNLLENRSFNDNRVTYNKTYEFTGKERDDESSYDYFGARYYDSRIGRWGGVEPLMDKYLSWTPYNYSMCNPIKNVDINGLDVIVSGSQTKRLIEEINNNTNLSVKIDDNGKLSATGEPENQMEFVLMQAINSEDITVNFITTDENSVNINGENQFILVGAFLGSEMNGEHITATQYINLNHADVWEDAGGSNVAGSILHEMNEAFIGAVQNPDVNYGNSSIETMKASYLSAHNAVKYKFEGNEQYYPKPGKSKDRRTVYLVDENEKPFPVYHVK